MRISLKVLGLMWLGLFLIIGGLLFNAYSKFKPETFIALLTEQVQKNYPGAKLHVGKVSYRFSLDFNLNLKDIHLRRDDKLLGSIGVVELKVPWWLLLVKSGNAHINLKDLEIYVDHQNPRNSEGEGAENPSPEKEDIIQVSLPSYLAEAKFTLRAKNITIRDLHNSRRYFVLSKLLVREFHYGKNSAFELNIPISITHNETKLLSELWLFGDITPEARLWKLNYRGEFRTKGNADSFQIEDLVIGGKADFYPASLRLQTAMNLEIEKKIVGQGEFKATQEDVQAQMSFTEFPVNYLGFVYEAIKTPYLPKLKGVANGNFEFSKAFESATAKFSGKFSFDSNLQLTPATAQAGKWQMSFENNRWEISFISPKGEVSFFRRSFIDLKTYRVAQYNEEIGFSGLDLSEALHSIPPLQGFAQTEVDHHHTTMVSLKNCFLGDQPFNGEFRFGSTPAQKFYQGQLSAQESALEINYVKKGQQQNLSSNFKKMPWHQAFSFFTPFFAAQSAVVAGNMEGRWSESWESGQWVLQLRMDKLEKPSGLIQDFIQKSFGFFQIKAEGQTAQTVNLVSKGRVITVNSLMLDTPESVKLTGQLSTQQKSYLTLSYPASSKVKPVRKEVLGPYWLQKEKSND